MTEIKTDDFRVGFEAETATIKFRGSFRLGGLQEYSPIVGLLNEAAVTHPPALTLDLRELEFLNSSGINIISKFVIAVRQQGGTELVVLGSKKIPWQSKSLLNLQRLMPSLKLVIEG